MIIYAVYLFKSDGRPIVYEHFQSKANLPNVQLLGGLVSALKGFTAEILQNDMKTLGVQGVVYHIRSFGFFNVILVTNENKDPIDIIQEIGLSFMKDFGEDMLDEKIRVDKYYSFKDTIKKIVGIHSFDESHSLIPTKKLSPQEILSIPKDLQKLSLIMLSISEGTIENIKKESNGSIDNLEGKIEQLQQLGYIGKKMVKNIPVFFCTS